MRFLNTFDTKWHQFFLFFIALVLALCIGLAQAAINNFANYLLLLFIIVLGLLKPKIILFLLPIANIFELRVSPYLGIFKSNSISSQIGGGLSILLVDALILLMLFGIFLQSSINSNKFHFDQKIIIPSMIFIIAGLISLLIRYPNNLVSIQKMIISVLETYIFPIILFIVISSWKFRISSIELLSNFLWLSGIILGLGVLLPALGVRLPFISSVENTTLGFQRFTSFWRASNITSAGIVLPICFSWFQIKRRDLLKRIIYIISFSLMLISLLPTLTRSVWIAIPFSILIVSIFFEQINKTRKFNFLSIIILIGISGLILFSTTLFENYSKFNIAGNRPLIVDQNRLMIWEYAIQRIISSPPLIGYVSPGYFSISNLPESNLGFAHLHNTYLQIIYDTGILGFLGFMGILYLCFRNSKLIKYSVNLNQEYIYLGLVSGLIGLLFVGLFEPLMSWPTSSYTLMLALGIFYQYKKLLLNKPGMENIYQK